MNAKPNTTAGAQRALKMGETVEYRGLALCVSTNRRKPGVWVYSEYGSMGPFATKGEAAVAALALSVPAIA